jgi:diacylglycerol kinase family enzyme
LRWFFLKGVLLIRGVTECAGVDFVLNAARIQPDLSVENRIRRIAREYDVDARIHIAQHGADLTTLTSRALASNGQPIVAGGGDGSISSVASVLAGTDRTLGVLPLGTLNHFAKDLNIPLEIDDAIRTVFSGRATQVDVGEVNGRIFLNNSSLGIYPRLVRLREKQEQSGRAKFVAMARSLVAVMRHYSRVRVRVSPGDRGGKQYDTPLLFVGNNRYEVTGLNVGSRTSLDGGTLWVCTAPPCGPRELLALGVRALLNHLRDGDLEMFAAKVLMVSSRHKHLEVSADGEVFRLDTPLQYRSRPKALRVVVPAVDASGP